MFVFVKLKCINTVIVKGQDCNNRQKTLLLSLKYTPYVKYNNAIVKFSRTQHVIRA